VDDEDVRLAVYSRFAGTGAPPTVVELAGVLAAPEEDVRSALRRLAGARHVVLDDADAVVMAHPFSAVPLGFSVMGKDTLWWGGCAWDSFALPHLLDDEPEVLVATTCPACGRALAWIVGRDGPPEGEEVAHFLVPAAHMWDDVVHTCGNQRLFCSPACVDVWLARTGARRGDVLDLATLWRLASRWYEGRLTRGYVRRDPLAAQEYFRSVGLAGPFWSA
jgi:Alkylmercury lyase